MNWLKNWINGNEVPAKQATPQTQPPPSPPKEEPQVRYLRDTLDFTKQQRNELRHKQNEHERWQQHYGALHVDELKKLSGTEFEDYLAQLFKSQGYQVEMTPSTGDYGADLILHKDQQRTAVQAKCYTGSVGVTAVQEALSGMAYYRCHSAWVVTTGNYTTNAVELAKQSKVRLFGRNELGKLILQMQNQTSN